MRFHLLAAAISLSLLSPFISGFPSFPPGTFPNTTAGAWQSFENLTGCHMGDHVNGLAKLKQYFSRFGYIPNSLANFTDSFDSSLESALREYQLNFNLNTTGFLDESTLQQIVKPRCGIADIINGTSNMNSGKSASSTHNFRTVAHYTFFPNKPTWPPSRRSLTYGFLPANQLSNSQKSVFSRAFDRWATVTPLTFTESDSYNTADIRIGFYRGDHGDGEPFDGVLGTLAHAFSPTSGRFHLDLDENWVIDDDISTSTSPSAIDLESVAVHEIGHLLGLGHSSVEESIMFPTISSQTKKVVLASDDIQGIQELYGSNPNYNGSTGTSSPPSVGTTPSSRESDTSNGGVHSVGHGWALMVLMGFSLFLLLL